MAARVWGGSTAKRLESPFPDCGACLRPEKAQARKRWGCDNKSEYPVFDHTCSVCNGAGYLSVDAPCSECEGVGMIVQYRCPTAILRAASVEVSRGIEAVVRAYIEYDSRNVLPFSGGFAEQSAAFAACCAILDSERGHYNEEEQKHMERQRKAADAKASQGAARGPVGAGRPTRVPMRRRR